MFFITLDDFDLVSIPGIVPVVERTRQSHPKFQNKCPPLPKNGAA
jgi:hypothetical protein